MAMLKNRALSQTRLRRPAKCGGSQYEGLLIWVAELIMEGFRGFLPGLAKSTDHPPERPQKGVHFLCPYNKSPTISIFSNPLRPPIKIVFQIIPYGYIRIKTTKNS